MSGRVYAGGVDLTPQEAADRLAADDALLIDVREPYEYEAGRIEGARHVPFPELSAFAQELDPERPVIFVCRVGGRSAMAAGAFQRAGFDAHNLTGGVVGWERAGLPFTGAVADH
jgi:rhodanese-related sulfurtransferase